MRLLLYISCLVLTFISCKKDDKNMAFLGGEIINPNTDFVVLYKFDKVLDTAYLDNNNRFSLTVNNLESGFYTFKHGNEIQMVLLEPKDSIMLRLNTLDFDESLVYTGHGARKNNYLINDFLQNEIEEKRIFKYCQLNPLTYVKRIDSIKEKKNNCLKNFQTKYKPSPLFNKIAQANIDFSYYSSKEIYPFIHYGHNKKKILKSLPDDFYAYRNEINYNDDFFKDYFNYVSFLKSSFNTIALNKHLKHNTSNYFERGDLCYNLDRLYAIDSLVTNTTIKNELLHHYTITFLSKNKNLNNNETVLKYYLSKSSDIPAKEQITKIHSAIKKLSPGEKIPDIALINYDKASINIKNLINKPTVIYFWSHAYHDHFIESHKKVNDLKIKYPEVNFISINIDDYDINSNLKTLQKSNFKLQNEYFFKNPKKSMQELAIQPLTKVILLHKDTTIENSNANIFANNFEQELLGLLNQ